MGAGYIRGWVVRMALLAGGAIGALALPGAAHAAGATPQVVGGTPAAISSFPFAADLYDKTSGPAAGQTCGAVIVDATHVITAAHCVVDDSGAVTPAASLAVLAGTADLTTPSATGAVTDNVSQVSFDPAYNPSSHASDVALLTLQQPLWSGAAPALDGTSKIAPVPQITSGQASTLLLPGAHLTVSGWGVTDVSSGASSSLLQSAVLGFVAPSACQSDWKSGLTLTGEMVCAGGGTGDAGRAPCYGDSGGPLVVDSGASHAPNDYLLVGIVDLVYANTCAQAGFPSVFQSVQAGSANATFLASNPPAAPQEQASSHTTMSGLPATGQPLLTGTTLTCNAGQWIGSPSLTYAWYADDGFASTLLASGQSYTVKATDWGSVIYCAVTATNAGGYATDADFSEETQANDPRAPQEPIGSATTMGGLPPANVPLTPGTQLTCRPGAWSNNPSLSYAFYRDDGSGNLTTVSTTAAYTVTNADLGDSIYCAVTASNAYGVVTDADYYEETEVTAPPVPLTLPSITGTPQPGSTLTCQPGTWTGTPAPTLSYEFEETLPGGIVITVQGQFDPVTVPPGTTITCTVTATNQWGQVPAKSSNQLTELSPPSTVVLGTTAASPQPSLRLQSQHCTAAKCVIVVAVADPNGPPLTSVTGAVSATERVSCTKHGHRTQCSRSVTHSYPGSAGAAAGTFTLTLKGLAKGLHAVTVTAASQSGAVKVSMVVHVRVPRR